MSRTGGRVPEQTAETRYFDVLERELGAARARSLRFYLPYLLGDVDFGGRRVLDVGGGIGECSFYAAARGAREAVCIEPEAEGSTRGVQATFRRVADALGEGKRVRMAPTTFQAYEPDGAPFDVIVMHNSIHHLDESAVGALGADPEADEAYHRILSRLRTLAAPGATLVVADASRRNLYPLLGLRNPFLPQINYSHHPTAETWRRLLTDVGFVQPRVRWLAPRRFGAVGAALCSNAVAAFLLTSHFRLTMTWPGTRQARQPRPR
jgi:SAM-dependent methyltransferase